MHKREINAAHLDLLYFLQAAGADTGAASIGHVTTSSPSISLAPPQWAANISNTVVNQPAAPSGDATQSKVTPLFVHVHLLCMTCYRDA